MAFKHFEISNIGTVTVYKRRGTKSLRVSVRPDGSVRISIPTWAPYASGLQFAISRADWIRRHQSPRVQPLVDGAAIGKTHHLYYEESAVSKPTSRIKSDEIVVTYPLSVDPNGEAVQAAARAASIRALKREAERLLPPRLQQLANHHGFSFAQINVRQLKSRWGSCDQAGNITLNIFLMQLPWELIDYVLLHELTHTRIMRHGAPFWDAMRHLLPDVLSRRKAIRTHNPSL